ncbi:MAG: glycosyltransferase family 2 protein [Candidatus Ancaeobacter aquaticus]|nr:glycosyltransferase family 2 protein [Candidatus Ancaeobacter aquaticus]
MISAVINTLNAERSIERTLVSLKDRVEEIVVVDMHSDDATVSVCKKYTDKIYFFDRTGYVEPARNFAIEKASHPYILVIDADEEAPPQLLERLRELTQQDSACDYVKIPMRTYFLGHSMHNKSMWPDYHIRFFKKGMVSWNNHIHSFPNVTGKELLLEAEDELALKHYFCEKISDFLKRIDGYTDKEAESLLLHNTHFRWQGLLRSPTREFTKRFFKFEGYIDGSYGLIYSLLMACYGFISYAKAFERGHTHTESLSKKNSFLSDTVQELYKCFLHIIGGIARLQNKILGTFSYKNIFPSIKLKVIYICANILKK